MVMSVSAAAVMVVQGTYKPLYPPSLRKYCRWNQEHNIKRGLMTQGSKSHRVLGLIGAGTMSGCIYKWNKMLGRMGGTKTKITKLKIMKS